MTALNPEAHGGILDFTCPGDRITEQRVSSPKRRGFVAPQSSVFSIEALGKAINPVTPSQERPVGYEYWHGNPWDPNATRNNI